MELVLRLESRGGLSMGFSSNKHIQGGFDESLHEDLVIRFASF